MGKLSDWLGGKKAPPPPKEIRESAQRMFALAQGQEARIPQFRQSVDAFLPILDTYSGQLQSDHDATRTRALALGDDYGDLWGESGLPALSMAGQDAVQAGSPARQEEEKRRAIEMATAGINSALRAREDQLRRRGNIGGGADSPHLSVLTGAALGAAGNQARLQERQYGEAFRRSFAPIARDFGTTGLGYLGQGADARMRAFQAAQMVPQQTGALFGAEGGLTQQNMGMFGNAQGAFQNSYQADLMKAQADNARRSKIFGNVMKIGLLAAGGIGAGLGAAGGAASSLSAGAGAGSTLGMKLGSSLVAPGVGASSFSMPHALQYLGNYAMGNLGNENYKRQF